MVAVRLRREDRHRHGGQPFVARAGHRYRHQAREGERLESIFDLMEKYAPLAETTSGITPSGGMHLYHAMPKGEPPVEGGWLPSVDIAWLVPVPPSAS
jgi:hypothetical protein